MAKDTETEKLLTEADHIQLMTESDGWRIVKAKLDQTILDLQNMNNIDSTDAATMLIDIKARKMASDLLFAFLKRDVYGVIEQQMAANATNIEKKDEFIDRG